MSSGRKRKSSDGDAGSPAKKKPRIESMYTRTDPITGKIGRVRKKDDKYWTDFTRRARLRKEKRDARKKRADDKKEKEDAKKKKAREERRKEREAKKAADAVVLSSESESSSDEDDDIKREDAERFIPFHNLTSRFKDHVCIVTGGGRGIGQACALRLAQEGGIIYILDNRRWKESVESIVATQKDLHERAYRDAIAKYKAQSALQSDNKNKVSSIKKPRKVRFKERVFHRQCDVTDRKKVQEVVEGIIGERGYIDVVLNCVNTTGKDYLDTHSHEVKYEAFDKIMKLNLYSAVNVCNVVIPFMAKESYGRIVNLANCDGKNGKPKCLAFAAAKAAVINVTKTLGQEYAGTGITVNCIAPQYDEYHANKLGGNTLKKASQVPMNRAIDMEELAGTVAFIASEENTYTTGFCYDLSGGTSTY